MKKILGLMLLCVASVLCSCEKEYVPQEVELSLDYTFIESGSMSRANGEEIYANFYDKYIKTKVLTPKTYELKFYNKDEVVLEIADLWSHKHGIRLPEGEYTVTGISHPIEKVLDRQYFPSDSLYLRFNEKVNITKDMTILTLTALYDSYLLLFDSSNINNIKLGTDGKLPADNQPSCKQLANDGINVWIALKKNSYPSNGYTRYYSLTILRNNEHTSTILLEDLPMQIGKYYYFNDMTNSFDIPPMESGN